MLKLMIGFIAGITVSVIHYDYGLTPWDLAQIIISNGEDIVEEVRENADSERALAESILNSGGLITRNSR